MIQWLMFCIILILKHLPFDLLHIVFLLNKWCRFVLPTNLENWTSIVT